MDQLDKGLAAARGKCESALGKVADKIGTDYLNLGAKINQGIMVAVGGITAGAAAVAGVLGKLAFDALPLEGVRAAFVGISGDADKMLATLRAGSLGMVRDTDLMASYNSAAQLVSKTFADQLPGAMSYLSKVSAATGQDMGYMIDSLVKGVGRLSPMILDNLGIQVNLVEANEAYAKSLGKSADELTKAEQQTAMMNMVMAKLRENTAKMPEVAGTAAQKWAALKVQLQNIKDHIGLALIPVLERLLEPIGKLAQRYLPMVTTFVEQTFIPKLNKVIDLVGGFGDMWRDAGGDIGFFLELVKLRLGAIGDALGIPRDKINAVLDPVFKVASALKELVEDRIIPFVQTHGPELQGALLAIGAALAAASIASTISGIAGAIASLTSPLGLVLLAVGILGAAWATNWKGIRDKVADAWEAIKPKVAELRAWLETHIPEAIKELKTRFEQFRKDTIDPFIEGINMLIDAYYKLRDAIGEALAKLREWLDARGVGHGTAVTVPEVQLPSGEGPNAPVPAPPMPTFAEGGDFIVTRPMPIMVGERGAERVIVQPLGETGGAGGGYTFIYNDYSGGGAQRAEDLNRELEHRYALQLR